MISTSLAKLGIKSAVEKLYRDPERNLPKLIDWADEFAGGKHEGARKAIRKAIEDPDDPYYYFVRHIIKDVDSKILEKVVTNFFINANLLSDKRREDLRKEYNCNIPWAILLDPTSACNLKCEGCWAAEYGNKLNLSFYEIDDIIKQGKDMGVYFYIYTGGEPLVRKEDILKLCKKHDDCIFLSFTNGTLIDEDFCNEMLKVKNFIPALSLEGFKEATDSRRGNGVYDKVIKAMDLLHKKKLLYGISCCYTSENWDSITSDEYWDMMIDKGAYFVWYFHYMPVGNDASVNLLLSPAQREKVYHRIRKNRKEKPLFAIDFQNDGEYVGGCIAGGRSYLHINANGDCDPCVFIHYSDSNIREKSLLQVMQSPLFMAYHDNQPFNENMLRPCPMLENPEILLEIIGKTQAHSTDVISPESVESLCLKCKPYSRAWAPKAEDLWEKRERARSPE